MQRRFLVLDFLWLPWDCAFPCGGELLRAQAPVPCAGPATLLLHLRAVRAQDRAFPTPGHRDPSPASGWRGPAHAPRRELAQAPKKGRLKPPLVPPGSFL